MTLNPHTIAQRLDEIDQDIAGRIEDVEEAAAAWFEKKRDREQKMAACFMATVGTVAERRAAAEVKWATYGAEEEGAYEGQKAALRALETRGAIGMSLLRSYGRQS